MSDRPILFSAPMVRALLDGRKTQTRRVLSSDKPNSLFNGQWTDEYVLDPGNQSWRDQEVRFAIGDRLYVREAWRVSNEFDEVAPRDLDPKTRVRYEAGPSMPSRLIDIAAMTGKFRQGMHQPRWASRLTLTVTDVRVQRLQDISEADAKAEGALLPWTGSAGTACDDTRTALSEFQAFWDGINSDRNDGAFAWSANPWVVAVSSTVERSNIDEVA